MLASFYCSRRNPIVLSHILKLYFNALLEGKKPYSVAGNDFAKDQRLEISGKIQDWMKECNKDYPKRSHLCTNITELKSGDSVVLNGWIHNMR
jgi:DNA-binding ferritin-like protein (Dps family)